MIKHWSDLEHRPSAWALILANSVPIFGVMFLNWTIFEIIFLYWLENVIIGVLNVVKMITCFPDPQQIDVSAMFVANDKQRAELERFKQQFISDPNDAIDSNNKIKFALVPFFCIHYGIFCLVHGIFVVVLFSGDGLFGSREPFQSNGTADFGLGWFTAVLSLVISHTYSLFTNYFGNREYQKTMVVALMFQPYARIVVLHLAILFGGFLIVGLGSPMPALILFVVLKTMLDLTMHLREHKVAAGAGTTHTTTPASYAQNDEFPNR